MKPETALSALAAVALACVLTGCGGETPTPYVKVTSPNGGETWYFDGDDQGVTWTSSGIGDSVDIYCSDDNGASWVLVDNDVPNSGSYTWQLPDIDKDICLVRVQKAGGLGASDVSDAVFTIAPAAIALVAPDGGEVWPRGLTRTVEWTSVGLTNVKVEVSIDGGAYTEVTPSTDAATGTYDWNIAVDGSTQALVRVSDAADGSPSATSAIVFTITAIDVTSPTAGVRWFYQGLDEQITWTNTGLGAGDKVDLHYSIDGGPWTEIALDEWNTGAYDWTIPGSVSDQCLVRVRQTGGTGTEDVSGAFSIAQSTVTLVSPTTGADWVEWFDYDIEWTATGTVTNVDIEYSWDYGDTWSILPGGYNIDAASSPFIWKVERPMNEGYTCYVRVADHAEPSNAGVSDAVNITPLVWAIQTPDVAHFSGSSFAWGDYDADGNLDFAVSGYTRTPAYEAFVYEGDGAGAFTGTALSDAFGNGELAWSDVDLDDDIDLGVTGFYVVDGVFENSGGSFTLDSTNFTSLEASTLSWGDYDNDGDFDLFVAGQNQAGGAPFSRLYANNGGVFSDSGIAFTNLEWAVASWGDADNDGDVDLILTGEDASAVPHTLLYRNDGGGTFVALDSSATDLPDVSNGEAEWGDFDNDGYLDLAIGGDQASGTSFAVFRNDQDLTFTPAGAGFAGWYNYSAAWGDADCDGDLDLAFMALGGFPTSRLFRNEGGSLSDSSVMLIEVSQGQFGWGDWDGDGDLDLAVAGTGFGNVAYLWIYENSTPATFVNARPPAPTGLGQSYAGGALTLTWTAPSGDETPARGLSYFVEVWTASTTYAVAMADPTSGEGRVPIRGPIQPPPLGTAVSWKINVPSGATYSWRVQSVDTSFRRSAWATGADIVVPP